MGIVVLEPFQVRVQPVHGYKSGGHSQDPPCATPCRYTSLAGAIGASALVPMERSEGHRATPQVSPPQHSLPYACRPRRPRRGWGAVGPRKAFACLTPVSADPAWSCSSGVRLGGGDGCTEGMPPKTRASLGGGTHALGPRAPQERSSGAEGELCSDGAGLDARAASGIAALRYRPLPPVSIPQACSSTRPRPGLGAEGTGLAAWRACM